MKEYKWKGQWHPDTIKDIFNFNNIVSIIVSNIMRDMEVAGCFVPNTIEAMELFYDKY